MTPPQAPNDPPAARISWAAVPVLSLGLLAFIPFLAIALQRRRPRDWLVLAGYLAAVALEAVTCVLAEHSDRLIKPAGAMGLLLGAGGALHAYVATGSLPGPMRAGPVRDGAELGGPMPASSAPASPWPAGPYLDEELAGMARARMARRLVAREIAAANMVAGRELSLGRPELPRAFDDGGLVDVNNVPGWVLTANLGLSPDETADVLTARAAVGRFASVADLTGSARLPPGRLDAVADLIFFG